MTANSIRLIGNASALMSKQRRRTILSKINSSGAQTSLASEDFPDAGKYLFGEGFESRIKTRSETAKTLLQAVSQRSSQFFRGRTTQFQRRGGRWSSAQGNSTGTLPGMDISLHPIHVSHLPLAGRLKHCLANWELITSDPWVLETITGLKLNFVSPQFQVACPQQAPQTEETKQLINLETTKTRAQELLRKGAVQVVPPISGSPGIFEHPTRSPQKRRWATYDLSTTSFPTSTSRWREFIC